MVACTRQSVGHIDDLLAGDSIFSSDFKKTFIAIFTAPKIPGIYPMGDTANTINTRSIIVPLDKTSEGLYKIKRKMRNQY